MNKPAYSATRTHVKRIFRVTLPQIVAARAVPIAEVVGAVVKLNRHGFGLCPFHDESTPSFHIHWKRNSWKCFGCGAGGDVIAFIQKTQGLDFPTAVRELISEPQPRKASRTIPNERPSASAGASPESAKYIAELWSGAEDPKLAELYLYSRGIALRPKPLPGALRGHKRTWCFETHQLRPAVLAAVTGADGAITAIHRIWVSEKLVTDSGVGPEKGTRAPDLVIGKTTIGKLGAGAVRLHPPRSTLGLAEGIETALSAQQIHRVPVWATLGAARLGSIELPRDVRTVIIFGDNGSAGEKAAAAAVSAYRRRGYMAEALHPEPWYPDFNAQLKAG